MALGNRQQLPLNLAAMQGLRPYVQDENSMAHMRAGVLGKGVLGGDAGGGGTAYTKAKGTPGFPSARKALGIISNRAFDAENAVPGKTPAAGALPRRALGDITNAGTAGLKSQLRQAPLEKPAAMPSCRAAGPATVMAAAGPSSRAEEYAEGGVERLAGKGWDQLECDRLAQQDAEISARLAHVATFSRQPVPSFFPLWVRHLQLKQQLQGLGAGATVL